MRATSVRQRLAVLDAKRLWQVWNNVRLAWRLLRDGRVGWLPRLTLLAAGLYAILPIDFLPDVYPLVGQVDDLALLLLAWKLFLRLCPRHVVDEHARAIAVELTTER